MTPCTKSRQEIQQVPSIWSDIELLRSKTLPTPILKSNSSRRQLRRLGKSQGFPSWEIALLFQTSHTFSPLKPVRIPSASPKTSQFQPLLKSVSTTTALSWEFRWMLILKQCIKNLLKTVRLCSRKILCSIHTSFTGWTIQKPSKSSKTLELLIFLLMLLPSRTLLFKFWTEKT